MIRKSFCSCNDTFMILYCFLNLSSNGNVCIVVWLHNLLFQEEETIKTVCTTQCSQCLSNVKSLLKRTLSFQNLECFAKIVNAILFTLSPCQIPASFLSFPP